MNFFVKKIVSFLFSRILLKLVTLALAIFLWLMVQGREQLEISSRLDIRLVPDATLALKVPEIVSKDVTIRGPRSLIEGLNKNRLKATVVLPAQKGMNRIRIEKSFLDKKWDSRLDLIIHEPYVTFDLDTKISKTLKIKVVLIGSVIEGYQVEKTSSTPRNVTLSGPEGYLNELSHISTKPVSLDNKNSDFTEEVELEVPDIANAMFSEKKVHVSINVGFEKINRLYENVLIEVKGTNLVANPIPNRVNVILQSDINTLDAIKPEDLKAFVQAQDLSVGEHRLEVQVQIPPGTTLVESERGVPETIMVNLYKPPTKHNKTILKRKSKNK